MLKRKMMQTLQEWKRSGAKVALNIIGARQTGKSTVVREFGKSEYTVFIEINFIETPSAKAIFEGAEGVQQIVENLTAFTGISIVPNQTLILLDEIQECPQARTAIKFLVEDGRADYVETGSLLGVRIQEIQSYPVGFERIVKMYPMDFEEFLWACGVQETVLRHLKEDYDALRQPSPVVHSKLLQLFYAWLTVGGMPQAVQEYVNTNDLAAVALIQEGILSLYRSDVAKYAKPSERVKILSIFDSIPSQLDQKNRRFILTDVLKNARLRQLESSFLWLSDAGIALPCYNTREPQPPLMLNEKRSLFRLYLCDTGLLCRMSLNNVQFPILKGDLSVNSGSILENAFAQALASKGKSLYYYDSKKIGELDFIVQTTHGCDVLEIKSGNDYRKHAALDRAREVEGWHFQRSVVFSAHPLSVEKGILYLPFYMILFYETAPEIREDIYPIDVQDLNEFYK